MRRLRAWFLRFIGVVFGSAGDRELSDELQSHLQLHIEENLRRGMSAEEARRDALVKLGGIEQTKELCRERRSLPMLETLFRDVHYALRMFGRNSGFTFVAVMTIALGIGANTAIFSVINAVLLEPLPFHDPDRLVRVFSNAGTPVRLPVSGEDYFDWQAQNSVFVETSLFASPRDFNASGAGEPETVSVDATQSNFFSVLGVSAEFGRTFATGEDQPGTNHVAILSHRFWQSHFGASPGAIGSAVKLDFQTYTIIGIMPRSFNYPERVDLWIPLEMAVDKLGRRGNYSYKVLARLRPGATLARAQSDMMTVTGRLETQFPITNSNRRATVVPMKELLTGDSRPQLLVLLGAVALVLLVACTNVANLLLARASGRRREIALRAALGAGRWRLIRQMLTESVMLSCFGAVLGLAGAWWLIHVAQSVSALPIPRQNAIQLDATVLAFTMGVSLAVGLLFGLAPALEVSRLDINEQLKAAAGSLTGAPGWRLRNALIIAEIATSLALLVGAGLLLRTFARMRDADIGVQTRSIITAAVVLPETKYKAPPERRQFYESLLDRVEHSPGVDAAAISQQIPLEGSHGGVAKLQGDTDPKHEGLSVNWNYVTPSYFHVFGIPFVAGRNFSEPEVERAAKVGILLTNYWESGGTQLSDIQPNWATSAIINRAMVAALWPNQDAVGKVFLSGIIQPVTVVGVVGNESYGGIREPATPEVYFPFTEELNNKWYPPNVVLRLRGRPEEGVAVMRAALQQTDSELSLFRVRTMQQVISDNMQDTTLQTVLLAVFAGLALVLACVGTYGVMAYFVAQRTREIGVRVAMGAQRGDILRLVLRRGSQLAAWGILTGLVAGFALTRFLASELFGVTSTDPLTFTGVSLLLGAVALLACYVPARRATRVDPIVVLRYE